MLTRRGFLASAMGAAGLAGLTACGGNSSTTNGSSGAKDLAFLNWDPVEKGTPLANAVADFEKASGIKVKVQPAPASDYDTKLLTIMSSGSTPDAIRLNDDYVLGYSQQNTLLDLNPYIEKDGLKETDFFEHPFNFPIQQDGKHTAWATGTQPNMIFYNVDAFKEAGVPLPPTTWTDEGWKWDDFLEAAKRLTIPGKRYGCLVFDDTSSETTFTVNNGTDGIYSKDGKRFTLADPGSVEGIQFIADLTLKHKVQPPWSQIQSGEGNPNYALSLFATGKIAMMTRNFGSAAYMRQNVKDFKWDLAPIPGNKSQKTISTLIVWAIPAKAKNPDQAWKLLKSFTDPEGAKALAVQRDLVPAGKEAAKLLEAKGVTPEHVSLVIDATENGVNENFNPHIQQARALYRPLLDVIYTGQQSAADALGGVKDRVEQALNS
ncbi:ABC transporter substrate-binding protein [Actinopolymorpha pittospori]|uniref:ABC-type glycerol-3-phosphate transport system substrate-binding protein n=1 Tax=Actinopolymorpha pittospori TaxID=648752 RepID=A0A927R940_9ACTN|nr:sugar ABC transporter substrate-binding protein [Actinopolymorpha pittospori]MBE1606079.1 ABC-type glycerol-3-phosphate transport system substrate-binding protein [Actinopolymorpha pittospori]